jgi:putative ABC transport system permease protein
MPESLLAEVQKLPGVALAAGSVTTSSLKLIGKDGKVISSGGGPALGFSVTPSGQPFNPTKLTAGSWPAGPGQVVIDKSTASKGFHVGDRIGVQAFGPAREFTVSGIAELPNVSVGGATFAIFDQPTAQALFHKQGALDAIRVQSKSGVETSALLAQIKPLLSNTQVVRSGTEQAKKDEQQAGGFIKIIRYALLAFAGIALFVGAFVIANTLSITIAQRMREFATLRTLGASRRQVMWSVVTEAFVIGVVGSVAGLFLGLGLAKLLNALFVAFGIDLPHGSTVFATRTIVVSLLVGTTVTVVASVRPARRATRVPPIAAVREGSVLPPSRWAKYGTATALVVLAVAVALVSIGTLAGGLPTGPRLLLIGVGVLLLFFGVSMNAPKIVRPLASVFGVPAEKIGKAPGLLARDNATRNPARTASTASALMIGLTLVTFVAIFGAGLRSSFEGAVNKLFIGDYAITSTNTFTPIEAQAGQALVGKPGITDVTAIRAGSARYLGDNTNLTAVQPNLNTALAMDWTQGDNGVPGRLGDDGFFASKKYAEDRHLRLGSPITLEFPSGKKTSVKLKGIWNEPNGGSPFAHVTISTALFDRYVPRPQDLMVLINTPGGVTDANTAALERDVKGFADAKVQTRDQFKSNFEAPINKLLNLLYALLALSVVVSLVGIINTLVLTVFERTRELGMLRAVGMTRRQVRMMIRYESIATSLMGAGLGIVVGTFLAALVIHALSGSGVVFAIPWTQLLLFVLASILVGILAAVLPARRAARLNVLQALQYE